MLKNGVGLLGIIWWLWGGSGVLKYKSMMKGMFKEDQKVKKKKKKGRPKGQGVGIKTEKFVRDHFNFPGRGIEYLEKQKKCSS